MHFVQKLISIPEMNYMFPTFIKEFKKLSTDKQGIVVLKSFIANGCNIPEIRYAVLDACQNCVN